MIILTIRTDKPEAEIGLFDGNKQLAYEAWQAHRELSDTIHLKIEALLKTQHHSLDDIEGIVCFQGPGSFTGLRIGLSVANAFAKGYDLPIVGAMGDDWAQTGIGRLEGGENDSIALPHYGAPAHITAPRK